MSDINIDLSVLNDISNEIKQDFDNKTANIEQETKRMLESQEKLSEDVIKNNILTGERAFAKIERKRIDFSNRSKDGDKVGVNILLSKEQSEKRYSSPKEEKKAEESKSSSSSSYYGYGGYYNQTQKQTTTKEEENRKKFENEIEKYFKKLENKSKERQAKYKHTQDIFDRYNKLTAASKMSEKQINTVKKETKVLETLRTVTRTALTFLFVERMK